MGDQLSLRSLYTEEGMWYGSLDYSLPLGGSGLRGKVGYAHTYYELGKEFADRDTVVLGGSTDNEFCKLAWRRDHGDLTSLPIWQFADNGGKFARDLGILDEAEGVALRATFVVDPHNVVQHVYVTNLNVGRAPADTLRVVDALQTDELCACNRPVGGETLAA